MLAYILLLVTAMFSLDSSASILGLDAGKDTHSTPEPSDEPLHDAAYAGNIAEVRRLLEQGYDVNLKDRAQATPLHYAASGGHLELADMLLNLGANVNAEGHMGYTPLHLAYFNGHLLVITKLLSNGADPEIITALESQANLEDDGDGLPTGVA